MCWGPARASQVPRTLRTHSDTMLKWPPVSLALVLLPLGMVAQAAGPVQEESAQLDQWIQAHGGTVNTYVGASASGGGRGLYDKQAIKAGDIMMSIPASVMINTGAIEGGALTPTLVLLRELRALHSRFKPFLNTLPRPGQVLNSCNLDRKWLTLLESDYWIEYVAKWQGFLAAALSGVVNDQMELTIEEVLGNVTESLTMKELQHACALVGTRYVATTGRQSLMMIPMFDFANHRHNCPRELSDYDGKMIRFIAKEDLAPGQEICYMYGAMHDDYALIHYGFLPEVQDPPRLLVVDHHLFNATEPVEYDVQPEVFMSTSPKELQAEGSRLQAILQRLEAYDREAALDQTRPAPGTDPVADMLLELQPRRRAALRAEIVRIGDLIKEGTAKHLRDVQTLQSNATMHRTEL